MKNKRTIFVSAAIFILLFGTASWGSTHDKMHESETQDMKMHDMGHDQHSGMVMGESMVILGQDEVEGVVGMAHLSDVQKQMTAMGRGETHHFMIMFSDPKTGQALEKGVVALKIRNPMGATSAPVKMIGMDGHFGADINLQGKGQYQFLVGTKLDDGVKRQYEFTYVLE